MSYQVFLNKFENMMIETLISSQPESWYPSRRLDGHDEDQLDECFTRLFKVLNRDRDRSNFEKNMKISLDKALKHGHTYSYRINKHKSAELKPWAEKLK